MKHFIIRQFLFLSLLLSAALPNYGQTTLSGVTLSGVTINSSSAAYDADYQAWLNRLTTLGYANPTAACSQILSDMVAGIKADGNWTELDRFWFFAHNGDSDGATVDMIDPSGHAQATKVNSPGWNAKEGFNSNGTSSYLNGNYTVSTDAVKWTQNSASFGVWMHTGGDGGAAARVLAGVRQGTDGYILFDNTSANITSRINQSTASNNAFTGTASFGNNSSYGVTRTASNAGSQWVNGSQVSTFTTVSNALTTLPVFFLAFNNNSTPGTYALSTWRLSVIWFGSGSVDQAEMHTRLSTAMTAIALLP